MSMAYESGASMTEQQSAKDGSLESISALRKYFSGAISSSFLTLRCQFRHGFNIAGQSYVSFLRLLFSHLFHCNIQAEVHQVDNQ